MSSYTLNFLCPIDNRKMYEIRFEDKELDSSFASGGDFKNIETLDKSRYEARKQIKVKLRETEGKESAMPRIKEKKSGNVNF